MISIIKTAVQIKMDWIKSFQCLTIQRAYIQTTNDLVLTVIRFEATYVNVFAYSGARMRKWENAGLKMAC